MKQRVEGKPHIYREGGRWKSTECSSPPRLDLAARKFALQKNLDERRDMWEDFLRVRLL